MNRLLTTKILNMIVASQTRSGIILPVHVLTINFNSPSIQAKNRDGKLLQGEKWQKLMALLPHWRKPSKL